VAGTALALAAGCAAKQDGAQPGASTIELGARGAGDGADSAAGTGQGQAASAALAGTGPNGAPLLTTEVGLGKLRAKVELLSVSRAEGGMVTARVRLTTIGGETYDGYGTDKWSDDWQKDDSIDRAYLVDPAAQKKYLAVKDSKGVCLCTHDPAVKGGGSTTELYATFPPVPANAGPLTIVFPDLPPFEHVTPGS
jgi:hypothetical protein